MSLWPPRPEDQAKSDASLAGASPKRRSGRQTKSGASGSELLVASEHVPDRVGEPAGDFDLDDLGAALLSDPPVGALLSAPVLSFAGCDSGSTRPPPPSRWRPPRPKRCAGAGRRFTARSAGSAGGCRRRRPLALLLVDSERRAAFEPSAVVKVLALVRAGETVTLVVPQAERRRLSLLYDFDSPGPRRPLRLSDGTSSVRFRACTEYEDWSPGHPYPDSRETQFNGGFFVRGAHCAPLEAWVEGRAEPLRFGLPFGTGDRPCPPSGRA
jgi:hypothetical protein